MKTICVFTWQRYLEMLVPFKTIKIHLLHSALSSNDSDYLALEPVGFFVSPYNGNGKLLCRLS